MLPILPPDRRQREAPSQLAALATVTLRLDPGRTGPRLRIVAVGAIHDLRERITRIEPQPVITRDNVTMEVDAVTAAMASMGSIRELLNDGMKVVGQRPGVL